MKFILIILLLFLSTSCKTVFSNFLFKKMYYSSKEKTNEFYTEIPYNIIGESIVLAVEINNKIVHLLFDTGGMTHLNENLIKKLDLEYSYTRKIYDANSEVKEVKEYRCSMDIGKLHVFNVWIKEMDSTCFDSCENIDGILGKDMLNQGCFYFNKDEQKLIITNSINKITNINNFHKQKVQIYLGDIYIKNNNKKFILDSGYQNGFILTNGKYNEKKGDKVYTIEVKALNSKRTQKINYQEENIKIFNDEYKGIVAYSDSLNINLLGSVWFLRNNIIIDISNKNLYIQKGKESKTSYLKDKMNIYFVFENGKILIQGTSKTIQDIKIGDIVQRVNQIDVSQISNQCEFKNFVKTIDCEKGISISVLQNGLNKEYTFSREELYK